MTMKPRGRKFRIRHNSGNVSLDGEQNQADASQPEDIEDGFGNQRFATADTTADTDAPEQSIAEELAAIRAEGLTGRQLRLARRAAQKQGLQPASDFDAVRLLRKRGIDPFERSNMLELVVAEASNRGAPAGQNRLPATVRQPANAPGGGAPSQALPPLDDAARAREIYRVQRDIARRRRRRLLLLATRLLIFVFLPTALVGYYYYNVATPLYAANSEFQIQRAEASSSGGLGSLFGGTSFGSVQESISVQSFLESRESMLLLDEELGLRAHFSQDEIDPLNRLAADASQEDLYAVYGRNLTIGYDPTEGLIRMEVLAADPALAEAFSVALIRYAEERVDQMSQRVRNDQMAGSLSSFEEANRAVDEANARVAELQQRRAVLSVDAEVSAVYSQINTYETMLQQERLSLAELLSVQRPTQARVVATEQRIATLEASIAELRASLTESEEGEASLAQIAAELLLAQSDLETRRLLQAQALQQLETARVEANRQSLYLTVSVNPLAPDEAAYPRKLENTLLAFLVFAGIYLMLSMTASILREQVSA